MLGVWSGVDGYVNYVLVRWAWPKKRKTERKKNRDLHPVKQSALKYLVLFDVSIDG